jgi:hypothetical protein
MTLLIHSLAEFGEIIRDALAIADVRDVVEIGCELGGMSAALADYVNGRGGTLTSIDPSPKQEFIDWLAVNPHVCHVPALSLAALPTLPAADAWVVDGDHNWFTVYNELHGIRAACARGGKPMLVFLHDVAWPCGRRDFYYAPETIPADFRHAHSWDGGVSLEWDGVVPNRGFRGAGSFAVATHEGGARNGVLTAIEDFIDDTEIAGREMLYAQVPAVFGLGVLFDKSADWAPAMADHVAPWHENALLATLERNRLRNYLTVIDWQDRTAQAA